MFDYGWKIIGGIIMKIVAHLYPQIISIENLLDAWGEFIIDKKQKKDVRVFARYLFSNINSLHHDLINSTYKHSGYQQFRINDPKARIIHKATVRDRLLHHVIYRILYPLFDKAFTYDSYSCRNKKGTHRAVKRFEDFTKIVSRNYSRPCFVLKCDIKKFFDSVDHEILLDLLKKKITDEETIKLLQEIIESFHKPDKTQLALFNLPVANRERALRQAQGFQREYFGKLSICEE